MVFSQHEVKAFHTAACSGFYFYGVNCTVAGHEEIYFSAASPCFPCPVEQIRTMPCKQLLGNKLFRKFSTINRKKIFLLIFKLLSAIEKIEQNISELTRKEALHGAQGRIEQNSCNDTTRKE